LSIKSTVVFFGERIKSLSSYLSKKLESSASDVSMKQEGKIKERNGFSNHDENRFCGEFKFIPLWIFWTIKGQKSNKVMY